MEIVADAVAEISEVEAVVEDAVEDVADPTMIVEGTEIVYAQHSGISLASLGAGGASGGGSGSAVINSEEFLKF